VALTIVASQADRAPYSQLAEELVMSLSEVHASVRRAEGGHLLHGPQRKNRPTLSALEEFLVHGLKYVFPPEWGELTRLPRPLLGKLVFVPRTTLDMDAIAEIASYAEYAAFGDRLRALEFRACCWCRVLLRPARVPRAMLAFDNPSGSISFGVSEAQEF
jgi:hypothetical protein